MKFSHRYFSFIVVLTISFSLFLMLSNIAVAQQMPRCTETRTPAPAFVYDPNVNTINASAFTGTIALVSCKASAGAPSPFGILNFSLENGADVNGQNHPTIGEPWKDPEPEMFHPASWNTMGKVLGITLDNWGNIYLASTSSFGGADSTPGRIYKIDTLTGDPETFADVPGDCNSDTESCGSSLGNLTTYTVTNDIYVASMDTGLVYQYGSDGTLKNTFDHGLEGRPAWDTTGVTCANMSSSTLEPIPNIGSFQSGNGSPTIKGRRIWAVEVYNTGSEARLYYSVIWRYQGTAPQAPDYLNPPYNSFGINISDEDTQNQIWSVGLDVSTGAFLTNTARLELSLDTTNPCNATWATTAENTNSNRWPIADIAFVGSDGRMILAQRAGQDNGSNDVISHEGKVIEATPNGTAWSLDASAFDGFGKPSPGRDDGIGGVAWDPTGLDGSGRVWIAGEALWEENYDGPGADGQLNYNIFGLIGLSEDGAPANLAWENGLLVDINESNNQEKQSGGDVEIACKPQFDYGDLPNGVGANYEVDILDQGARHLIHTDASGNPAADQIYLGSLIDAENDGQANSSASGDDTDGIADEDGIVRTSNWIPSQTATLDVSVGGGTGYVVGWVDWNQDGVFSASEMIVGQTLSGTQSVNFTVPLSAPIASGIPFNIRFRVFASQAEADALGVSNGGTDASSAFAGAAVNGEVEDYQWSFSPTSVSLLIANADTSMTRMSFIGLLSLLSMLTVGIFLFYRKRTNSY